MELKKEKSFPRGGKKPALFKTNNSSTFSFLRKPKAKKRKKVKQSEKKDAKDKIVTKPLKEIFTVKFVEDLKPSILQDGMFLLGIVSKITNNIINVSLPGGLRGVITVANVSEFYRSIIENSARDSEVLTLTEIFQVGDILPVKVLAASEEHHSLLLTSDPKIINEKLTYNLIENGFILMGSVKSQEEHGYIIDFGIENVNGFLNYEKVNENQNFKIGRLLRCCIIQCNVSPGACNVQLSVLNKDLQSAFIKKNSKLPVCCFIPGFQFEVTVKKILHDGVEVGCGHKDTSKGYIHENYFLKKFSNPEDLKIGRKLIATLLYVKPLVNFLYFKILPKKELVWPFNFGEIVSGKVVKVRKTGVIFKISEGSKKAKCFVPVSKLKTKNDFQDKSEILNLYPINKTISKIRLGNTDFMGRYYIGATDKVSVTEKYYSISDLKCGEIVPCKIIAFGKSFAHLEIGRSIKGIVAFSDMCDVPLRNPMLKFKLGQKVKARVLEITPDKLFVRLTMKPSLLKEKEILCDSDKCKKKIPYMGTVFKVMKNIIVVKFFNKIFGIIPKLLTFYPDEESLAQHFYKGQLVKCFIVEVQEKNKLRLSMLDTSSLSELKVGNKYDAAVINKTENGLFLNVSIGKTKKCKGYLPRELLTLHHTLAPALHSTYSPGEKLSVYCVINDVKTGGCIFGAEEVFKSFYEGKSKEELEKLVARDSVLPFLFRNKSHKTNRVFLQSLIPGKNECSVIVVRNDFLGTCPLSKYQLIYGRILNVQNEKVQVSTKLHDVWDKDFHISLDLLDSYLKAMTCLVSRQKNTLKAYNGNIYLGCPVTGVIEEVKANHAILRTNDGDLGIIEGKFEQGQDVNGKIIWIDGPEQLFYVKPNLKDAIDINSKRHPLLYKNYNLRGKIVFTNPEVVVSELRGRGKGELAFLPVRRHINDITNSEPVFTVGEELKLWVTRKDSDYFLAMDRRIIALKENIIWKKTESKLKQSVENLKRKLETEKIERLKKRKIESDSNDIQVVNVKLSSDSLKKGNATEEQNELPEVKEEKDADIDAFTLSNAGMPGLEFDNFEIKLEAEDDENEKQEAVCNVRNEERIELSSSSESEGEEEPHEVPEDSKPFKVGFNWDVLNNHSLLSGMLLNKNEPSSEDEDDESKPDKKKRRRLTAIERRQKAKSEEERLRFIEERLMDAEREPENADDFDRAVLADPNSSALWLKYMAFHIQGTEIEKARAVARRALKAISFREEQEKLNIWIALLNLENMYGSEESLNKTLSEALQVNEPYKIHLHMLNIHGQNSKFQEMEKLGNFMLKKYKDIENIWYEVASVYFSFGKVESARNVLQKALTVLAKNQHVPLISKFAQLENKHGSPERAQTLYESILSSFPKKVDIWSSYVDMLVKSNHIDLARQVLERAISQSLRPRKMKTLFKKFIAFEEAHGKPEDVEKVREAAVEYVNSIGSNQD